METHSTVTNMVRASVCGRNGIRRQKIDRNIALAVLLSGVAVIVAGPTAIGAEIQYELRIGATHSDNVRRSVSANADDTIGFVGGRVDLQHQSRRVNFDLLTDLNYNVYTDDSFDNELTGSMNADFAATLVENVLTWVATDRFGKLQTNPFRADTEENRGNFNNFQTGPELVLRFGSRMSLQAGARYNRSDFEKRETDNDGLGANVGIYRALTPNRNISLSGSYQDVDYDDDTINTDYERRAVFASFTSNISKGSVALSLGVNEVELPGDTLDGTYARLAITRQITSRTNLGLSYDQSFSDAGDLFSRFQQAGFSFGDTFDIPGSGEPFESRRISASLDYDYRESSFFLNLSREQEDYESANTLERRRTQAAAGVSRRLGNAWRLNLGIRASRNDYDNVDREDDNLSYLLGLSRRLTRTVSLDFSYRRVERDSNDATESFDENRYTLTLRYAPE